MIANRDAYSSVAEAYNASPIQEAVLESARALLSAGDGTVTYSKATHILDLGCGPGTLTAELIDGYSSSLPTSVKILGLDSSAAMLEQFSAAKDKKIKASDSVDLWNNVAVEVANAQELSSIPDNEFSHILAGIIFFHLPDSSKALAESHRVLKSGGVLALSCWPSSDWQSLMQLVSVIRPGRPTYNVPLQWRTEESVSKHVEATGFVDVTVRTCEVSAKYEDAVAFSDWIVDKMPGLQSALSDFSHEEKTRLKALMVSWLEKKDGIDGGVATGDCLICTARK